MVKPAQRSRHLAPGDKLGKYELIRQIAVGGMAELYLARTLGIEGFEKLVVVKRILPQYTASSSFVNMFLNEARLAATLHHPNIAQVYDIGLEDGDYFFAMEYVHGEDLDRINSSSTEQGVPVSFDAALTLVAGLCAGLHYAHEKQGADGKPLAVVHRDVSPSNVLVSYDGAVKLVDFGIARAAAGQRTTQGGLKGKIAYMSPEQCQARTTLDRRSDIFSIGTILYELTAGRLPFTGESEYAVLNQIVNDDVPPPRSFIPDYPEALEKIVLRALAREPAQRYSNALALQQDIEDFAHDSRLRVSPLVLARLMSTLFPARLEEWDEAKTQGAFFVEQHVVQTLIESGKTSDSGVSYPADGDEEKTESEEPPDADTTLASPPPVMPDSARMAAPILQGRIPQPNARTALGTPPRVGAPPAPAPAPLPIAPIDPRTPNQMARVAATPPQALQRAPTPVRAAPHAQTPPQAMPRAATPPQALHRAPTPVRAPQTPTQAMPRAATPPHATPQQFDADTEVSPFVPPQRAETPTTVDGPRMATPRTPTPHPGMPTHAPHARVTPVPGMPGAVPILAMTTPVPGTLVSTAGMPDAVVQQRPVSIDVTERVRVRGNETELLRLPRTKVPVVPLAAAGAIAVAIAVFIAMRGGGPTPERASVPVELPPTKSKAETVEKLADPPEPPAKPEPEPAPVEAKPAPLETTPVEAKAAPVEAKPEPKPDVKQIAPAKPAPKALAPAKPAPKPVKQVDPKPAVAKPNAVAKSPVKPAETKPSVKKPKDAPKEKSWNADSPFLPVRPATP